MKVVREVTPEDGKSVGVEEAFLRAVCGRVKSVTGSEMKVWKRTRRREFFFCGHTIVLKQLTYLAKVTAVWTAWESLTEHVLTTDDAANHID